MAMYEKCDYYVTQIDGSSVYQYSYYKNKENQNKATAQRILDDVKRRLVFEKVLTYFEDTGNGAELKEGMDAVAAGKDLKKHGYYFGKLTSLKQTLYYADDFEYPVENSAFNLLTLNEAGLLVTKSNPVESYDSSKDFSNEDKNESYTVYTKPFTVETDDKVGSDDKAETDGEKEEYELLYAVDGTVPLFGGNKGWYYGMWNAEKDFSIALFEGESSSVQSEKDFENKRNSANDSQNDVKDGKVTEADGESKVCYLAARKNEEIQEDGTISILMEKNTLTGESSLKTALIGSYTSIETEDEDGNAVTLNYAPYIKDNVIHTERYGGSAYYEACGVTQESGDGSFYMTNLRHTVTNGEDTTPSVSASVGLIVSDINKPDFNMLEAETVGASFSGTIKAWNNSDIKTDHMTLDMNADGAQDIISGGKLYLSHKEDGKVSFRKTDFEGLPGNVSTSSTDTDVYGTSFTTTGNVLVKTQKNNVTVVEVQSAALPSGGSTWAEGSSKEKRGFLDINGDGLPDLIDGYSKDGEIKVLMNNGHGFAESQSFDNPCYISESENYALSANMSVPIGNSSDNSQSKSLKTGVNISAGVSLSTSSSNTTKTYLDLNGDGLCDIVKMEPGDNTMKVRFNLGNSFGQETSVPLPEWDFEWYEGVGMGDASFEGHWIPGGSRFTMLMGKKDILTPQNFFGSMTKFYANSLDWNLSANASLCGNFGASLTWSIALGWFGFLNITASAGAGVNAGESASGITVKMMDIDGDGFVDHVIRFPKGSIHEGVWYKKNLTGRAQLLRKIKLPGGGECRIDYEEKKGTPEMPGSRYVMSKVTMADSCGKDGKVLFNHGEHETTVEYSYAGGYFDRAVKESYGYAEVTAEYPDSTKKILSFYNDSYYNKGMKKSESVTVKGMDGKDALISHVEYELEDSVPLVKKRTEVQLDEASGVQLAENISQAESTGQTVKRTVEYEYDDFGNVISIKESGSTDSKILEAEIEYFANPTKYIYSKPSLIEVKEEGKLLRKRSGAYDENGSLIKLSQFYTSSEHTDLNYTYDSYGNVKTITGANGDVTEYKYDGTHNQYIEEISRSADGVTYKSTAEWNKKFGKPAVTKDINGNSMHYTYDSWGRMTSAASDYDGDVPAVKYRYYGMKKTGSQDDGSSMWYTVTENKVTFDKNDTSVIKTLIASDGLGRTALTAKTGVVGGVEGFNLSGQIEYDNKGRVVKEGKPYFMAGSLDMSDEILAETVINYAASQTIKNPDVTEYDGADQVISITLSDGSLIKNEYSVEEGLSVQKSFDPDTENAGTSGNYTVSKKDFRGNVVKLEKYNKNGSLLTKTAYEYDALSQLKTALDAENNPVEVEYDMLGRKTSLKSKDSGTKEWFYNSKGNLEKERDSVLKARNEYITYTYDGFGRNTRIDYPQSPATEIEYGTSEDTDVNAAGKVKKITDSSGSREYEYGLLGEVKKETRSIKHIRNYLNKEESAAMEYTSDYLGRMQEITYPDGEVLTYSYDRGGQVTGVSGKVYGLDLTYVKDIQYDEYGQRTRIEYGNGAVTDYVYDEHRRWLRSLHTDSRLGETLQNLKYSFDRVGNVLGYTNDCLDEAGNYTTTQNYTYDGLYQLTSAMGESVYNPHRGGVPDYRTTYIQNFSFDANGLGKMLSKTSSMSVSQGKTLGGDGLVYDLDYEYDENFVHRLKRAGDRYYKYDESGRLTEEREGTEEETSDTTRLTRTVKKHSESVFSQDYGWGLSNEATREAQNAAKDKGSGSGGGSSSGDSGFKRSYTWDEKGRLIATSDQNADVEYLYGEDNQRAVKSSDAGETLYFNNFWNWSNNSAVYNGERTAKHIFLGSERIVTKLNSADHPTYSEESASTYYYHSDHLGSASVITDNDGREYERIEYTPYGEVWIDKASATYKTEYRFTGKLRDEETGLYYFGERYLDSKVSRWLSTDPALSDFISGQSNGMSGGIFNSVNMNLYHYVGNNPIKFTDPDGREQNLAQKIFAKGLNFAVTHSDKAAAFIQDHTNVTVTRNVYEGEKIQQDKTIYYQDNLSVEVCGIPLNNVQCQSTPDQPDLPGRDTIPNGTTGKADVGVSGATKDYIKDTLLFDDKGDFLHIKKPGTNRPGSWGCTIPKKDADVKETMDILRKDLGIENGKGKVNYSFDNSSEYRQNHRKENQQ